MSAQHGKRFSAESLAIDHVMDMQRRGDAAREAAMDINTYLVAADVPPLTYVCVDPTVHAVTWFDEAIWDSEQGDDEGATFDDADAARVIFLRAMQERMSRLSDGFAAAMKTIAEE